jgi:protoporphyrinogen IX oxidase
MIGFLGSAYPWVKTAHVVFVIFWMAGLFMLPRFIVYHQESEPGSPEEIRWIDRKARLIRIILNPSFLMVWAFGLALAINTGAYAEHWFEAKFIVVLGLSAYHGWMIAYARRLGEGGMRLSGRTLRMLNEVPGIATILIVILVIVRPF